VELRTEELATTAMSLDKTELLGRSMNIGRPKGYVPGTSAPGVAQDSGSVASLQRLHHQHSSMSQLPVTIEAYVLRRRWWGSTLSSCGGNSHHVL
jgi:hypothetical protein